MQASYVTFIENDNEMRMYYVDVGDFICKVNQKRCTCCTCMEESKWALEFGLLRFGVLETGVKNGIGSAIVAAGCCEKPYAAACSRVEGTNEQVVCPALSPVQPRSDAKGRGERSNFSKRQTTSGVRGGWRAGAMTSNSRWRVGSGTKWATNGVLSGSDGWRKTGK